MSLMRKLMAKRFASSPAKELKRPEGKTVGELAAEHPVITMPPVQRPVPMAERRARIAEGHARRNAPVEPVKTTAHARWPKPPPVQPMAPILPVRELSDAEARARGILPDGELFDDVIEADARLRGVEVFGEPLPPPPPIAAPLSRAVELAAAASADKQAQAAALEAQRAELEAKARWKSPCKAVDAGTGLPCGLLQGHTVAHRHARGEFVRVASGPVSREVDGAAWASTR